MPAPSDLNDNGGFPVDETACEVARDHRRRAFKAGIVSYQNHTITVECIVRDTNVGGAMLRFEESAMVPDQFALTVPIEGSKVDCRVVWRKGLDIGVEYVSEVQTDIRNLRAQCIDVKYIIPRTNSILRK